MGGFEAGRKYRMGDGKSAGGRENGIREYEGMERGKGG